MLILHLKCFDFKNGCTKILKTVEFPVELKMDPSMNYLHFLYYDNRESYN